ncbi:hypothetical protein ACE6H2_008946 [Prunus campanulata]
MRKKTKNPGNGKEKAAKSEEKRAHIETRSSHLRMTSIPFCFRAGQSSTQLSWKRKASFLFFPEVERPPLESRQARQLSTQKDLHLCFFELIGFNQYLYGQLSNLKKSICHCH